MHVEERHDIQAAVLRRQLQRVADVPRRHAEITVRQRDKFWPGSSTRTMKQQSDIIAPSHSWKRGRAAGCRAIQFKATAQSIVSGSDRQNGYPDIASNPTSRLPASRLN